MTDCKCLLLANLTLGGNRFEGLRCPACIDAIIEAKNQLVRELQGEAKARELLLAGMGSQAEICDSLKQSNRTLARDLAATVAALEALRDDVARWEAQAAGFLNDAKAMGVG